MKKILILFLLILMPLVAGCSLKVKKNSNLTAGVYKSFDKGVNWQPKRALVNGGSIGSIISVDINEMYFDPQDNNAIYFTSAGNGIFYSYNGGENWLQPPELNSGTITSIAVDPKDKCIIYVSAANRILKSIDCNRSWREIYIDSRNLEVTYTVVDSYNDKNIYSGNSQGEILKSFDAGMSWTTVKRFNNTIKKILIDPNDTRIIYVATAKSGIFKSIDSGLNWEDLNKDLKKYSGAMAYINLLFNPSVQNSLFFLNNYGILKTTDGGTTWEALSLITPPSSTKIYSMAVNPKNDNEIFYGTATTFYKTVNGGKNWITKRLPVPSVASYLLIDPLNPNIIYMGAKKIKS